MPGSAPLRVVPFLVSLLALTAAPARANTINQNTSWTINRTGATTTYRVVAYGDSIFAGYNGSLTSVSKRAGPLVEGEYLGKTFGTANIQVVRRTKSGAVASDVYQNKIVNERSYMQAASTRVVVFEMCGNDYLQARSSFSGQSGTCNYAPLDNALNNCTTYMERAMQAINTYATTARAKIIMNIYYPGYAADNVQTGCRDATTGATVNKQSKFLPYLARSNWRACDLAARYGFQCADVFAQWMGAEYDSNGDGLVDTAGLAWRAGESEADYVQRISVTLRGTLRDANGHLTSPSTSYDYLLSDDTHPTYTGGTIGVNIFTGSGSGSGAPDYSDAQIVNGQNPVWNRLGHEKAGWTLSGKNPTSP
ncbi:MAG: SGNH/GDSL hydrolase family protein [Anaeromyxobacter sp.]